MSLRKVWISAPHPPEIRRRAVELARQQAAPVAQVAKELGIGESRLRNWVVRVDIGQEHKLEHVETLNAGSLYDKLTAKTNASARGSASA